MCFWPTVFVTVAKLFVWRGHLCWHFSSTFQLYHLTFNAIVFKSEDVTSGTLFLSEEKTVLRKYHVNFYRRWPEQSVSQQIIWCVCVCSGCGLSRCWWSVMGIYACLTHSFPSSFLGMSVLLWWEIQVACLLGAPYANLNVATHKHICTGANSWRL